ncbi:hypothetical protein NZK35_11070 [Stieleria sp. ICT_E10.1]|nr:hypothetical protein [Stieleria sedimenti]
MDAEPPIASSLKSMLIGGGPVNASVPRKKRDSSRRFVLTDLVGRLFERFTLTAGGCIVELPTSDLIARLIEAA